jgi:CRP-like cAMP-binding protein
VYRSAGARLFRSGDSADTVYRVVSGEVLLTRVDATGEEQPRALRGAGCLLGVETLVGETYDAGAVCLAPTHVCVLARSRLDAWTTHHAPAARAFAILAAGEARRFAAERDGASSCDARLASFLLERHRNGSVFPLRKRIVASLLAMRPETLSRCLFRLASVGAIEEGTLRVRDVLALERMSEAA